jgi:hypothetical protein
MAKTKMRVPKYLAGVSVVQPENRSVTLVDFEKVLLISIGIAMFTPIFVLLEVLIEVELGIANTTMVGDDIDIDTAIAMPIIQHLVEI